MNVFNYKIIYYKGSLILYRKYAVGYDIEVAVKLVYIVSLTSFIINDETYQLDTKVTLKTLLNGYKKMIDEYNIISKR